MVQQTQIEAPNKWEDVAGIGPTRAERLRDSVGSYSNFKNTSSNAQKNKIASAVSGDRRNLPQFAENAIDAASQRRRSPDVVDSSLVKQQEVDQRSARTRSKTTIRGRNADADRSDLGFETMQRDPEDLDRAAQRFTEVYDDPYEPSPRDIGKVAEERKDPNDRATVQPLIGAATSRTVFASRQPGEQFRRELKDTAENTDRATASPGELADAFVDFVDQEIGLGPRGSLRGPTRPTDIGRTGSGRFDRPDTSPDVTPAPVARDTDTGEFGLDPFDLTSGGVGDSVSLFNERGESSSGGIDAPESLPGGFERSEIDKTEKTGFTEVVFRRESDIPGVDDVVRAQKFDGGNRVLVGADTGEGGMTGSEFSGEQEDGLFDVAAEAAISGFKSVKETAEKTDPFRNTGLDSGGGTVDDLETTVSDKERTDIMTSSFGRR